MTTSDYIEKAVEWLGLTGAGGLMGYLGGKRKQQAEGIDLSTSDKLMTYFVAQHDRLKVYL